MKNIFRTFEIIAIIAVIGFSFAACGGDDGGGGKDEEPVLTMTFTEDPYWNETGHDERYRWLYKYKDTSIKFDLSSMYANNKAYNFTYSFISNIDIDEFAINFQDKDGKGISDWTGLKGDIKKNTKYSGSALIPPNSDAVGTSSADNVLVFYVKNRNVTTTATITFYKFSLELVDNENGSGGGGDNDTFNSLDDFKNWLNGKGNNSASSPYNVKLNLPNLSGLADFLKGLLGKFVKLDFSGSSFTSIGADAFKGLTNLTGITLPSGVTSIGANAFDGCTNLTDITLPSGVTSIGANAFNGCTNLNSVTFNGTISSGNFSSTTPFPGDLRDKYLSGGAGTYTRTSGGTTWTKQGGGGGGELSSAWFEPIGSPVTAYKVVRCNEVPPNQVVIPATYNGLPVTEIAASAFFMADNITSVTISNSVTKIGNAAFKVCTSLTSVTIGSGVTSIGHDAFNGCTKLTSVTFNSTISSENFNSEDSFYGDLRAKYLAGGTGTYTTTAPVSSSAVWTKRGSGGGDNGGLSSGCFEPIGSPPTAYKIITVGPIPNQVVIPATFNGLPVTTITRSAFAYITNLTSITIPNSITSIESNAFGSCTNLTSVTFQGTISSDNFSEFAFEGDLYNKYIAGGIGTYTTTGKVGSSSKWQKQ